MTKQEAINELTRAAELCPTTPLAEACRMAVTALGEYWDDIEKELGHNCYDCKYKDRMPNIYPCKDCVGKYSDTPSNWEPKEVDT